MTISRVNEFAAEMLKRIEKVKNEVNQQKLNEAEASKDSEVLASRAGLQKSHDGIRKPQVDSFLLNFAANVTVHIYKQNLVKCERDDVPTSELDEEGLYLVANDDRPVTEETLQTDIKTLRGYFDIFKNTNGLPNYSPTSFATLVFTELAKLICDTLNAQALAANQPQKYLHYYELLFPQFRYRDYTSSEGDLGIYAPHEFFWGRDGRPVPILACLDARRRAGMFPPNVFLTEAERLKGDKIEISREDFIRLRAHSKEADDYCKAIMHKESEAAKDKARQKLVERLKAGAALEPFDGYLYTTDNKVLVENGFFRDLEIRTAIDLTDFIFDNAKPHEWKSLVKCIDDSMLFDLMLPKINDNKTPDRSILDNNFESFVEKHAVLRQSLEFHPRNRVGFLLLLECFRRQRASQLCHTGMLTQPFTSVPLVTTRENKTEGAEVLMDLCASSDFSLNQPLEYLKKRNQDAVAAYAKLPLEQQPKAALELPYKEISESVIMSGRLGCLTKKMISLCNDILAQHPDVTNVMLVGGGHAGTYNLESLLEDAKELCGKPRSQWNADIIKGKENLIAAYVTSRGGFNQCLAYPGHYRKDDPDFNRAMIYLFSEFYTPARDAEEPQAPKPETQSFGGWMFSAVKSSVKSVLLYSQKDKIAAIEDWKQFLRTTDPVNQFFEWCNNNQKSKSYDVMRNMTVFNSKTNALLTQASAVVATEFLMPVVEVTASASVLRK